MTTPVYTPEAMAALSKVGSRFFLNQVTLSVDDFEHINMAFSVSGEDLVLRKHLKDQLKSSIGGFYLDINASHPTLSPPVSFLSDQGYKCLGVIGDNVMMTAPVRLM
jgi:hypothetical protein